MAKKHCFLFFLLILFKSVQADHLTDRFSFGFTLFGAAQYGHFQNDAGNRNQWGSATGLDLEAVMNPTNALAFYTRIRFAAGNALNDKWQGSLLPWSTDLEDDLIDINRSGRNYWLEAWGAYQFSIGPDDQIISLTAGMIDSSIWIDDNAYAHDEMVHFMNDSFVTRAYLPAYDPGIAAALDLGDMGANLVYMHSRTGDDQNHRFHYIGAQIHYHAHLPVGDGTYRLLSFLTSKDFIDQSGGEYHTHNGIGISIDQEIGKHYGLFTRLYWQAEYPAVDYQSAYTAGLHIEGSLWGRTHDEAGFALGYLPGSNGNIESTRVAEIYIRMHIHNRFDITADLQYMRDRLKKGTSQRSAWIPGLRFVVYF